MKIFKTIELSIIGIASGILASCLVIYLKSQPDENIDNLKNKYFISAENSVYGLAFSRDAVIADHQLKVKGYQLQEDNKALRSSLLRYVQSVYQLGQYVNKNTFCDLYFYDKDTSDMIDSQSRKANHIRRNWTDHQNTFYKHWLLDDLRFDNEKQALINDNEIDRLKKYSVYGCDGVKTEKDSYTPTRDENLAYFSERD